MKFRIVEDEFNGYEAQVRRFGTWMQIATAPGCLGTNSQVTVEETEKLIKKWAKRKLKKRVVKEIEV